MVDEAIRCRQLRPITMRRTSETDAFSASRMRTPLGPSRTSKSLHRSVSTSDALSVTRRHARVGLRTARCAVRNTLLAENATGFDLRVEDPVAPCP